MNVFPYSECSTARLEGIIISRALDELGFGIENTVLVATSYLGIRLRHRYKRMRGQDIIKPGVHEIKEWKSWRMV